jgi:superfamily I DNA/RNA helicase
MNETWWLDPSQLDDKQKEILQELPETELLIAGPPGSGKTNILVLRANYVRSVAPRLLLLTFTRTLCEFLRAGPNTGRGDQIQKSEITTFMAWAKKVIRDHGAQIPDSENNFDADRDAVNHALEDLIDAQNLAPLYDVIFVDEVQDFREQELKIIRRLTQRINAAGDSRQRIWGHKEGLPTIEKMVAKSVILEQHYRIGSKICDFADQILPPKMGEASLAEGCNYPEESRPSSIEAIPCKDMNDQIETCLSRIKEQLRYITDEPIGVLFTTRDMRDRFWDQLSKDVRLLPISIRQQEDNYQAFGPNSLIRVMTVASAKGSEFRAVHLLGADTYRTNQRELAFTAVTRAKTEVALYHIMPLPGHMKPPTGKLPKLSEIF